MMVPLLWLNSPNPALCAGMVAAARHHHERLGWRGVSNANWTDVQRIARYWRAAELILGRSVPTALLDAMHCRYERSHLGSRGTVLNCAER